MPAVPEGFREVLVPMLDKHHRIFVAGNKNAKRLAFFQAGFPDDQTAFVPMALQAAGEGCLVAVSCMPEFDTVGSGPLLRPAGYTFDEAALCFGQAVVAFRAEADDPGAPLTLVLHDWGVAPGIIYTNRCVEASDGSAPTKLVLFDVLPPVGKEAQSVREVVIHLNYRAMLATSFLLSRISGLLGTLYLSVGTSIIFGLLGRWLNPVGTLDFEKGKGASRGDALFALPRISYPYYHIFKELIFGGAIKECKMPPVGAALPMLYIFGKEKNTMFHSNEGLAVLDKAKGCEQIGVDDAAHYVYLQQPEECWKRVKAFGAFSRL